MTGIRLGESYKALNGEMVKIDSVYRGGVIGICGDKTINYRLDGTPVADGWSGFSIAESVSRRFDAKSVADAVQSIEAEAPPSDFVQGRWYKRIANGWTRTEHDGSARYWFDLEAKTTPALPNDRLDKLEAQCTDIFRQLREARRTSQLAGIDLAKRIERLTLDAPNRVEAHTRIDDLYRRVASFDRLVGAFEGVEKRLDKISEEQGADVRQAHTRIERLDQRLGGYSTSLSEVQHTLARIEDQLIAEKPLSPRIATGECNCEECRNERDRRPKRKSLGWINVTPEINERGCFVVLHPDRETADKMASMRRRACVEIFEGDGL